MFLFTEKYEMFHLINILSGLASFDPSQWKNSQKC